MVVGLFFAPSAAVASLAVQLWLAFVVPVSEKPARGWKLQLASLFVRACAEYYPIKTIWDSKDIVGSDESNGVPFVVGLEPHHALPLSIASFGVNSILPGINILGERKCLATTIIFYVPLARHLWTWMGLRRASRDVADMLLKQGNSLILVPGGVKECFHISPTQETIYLRERKGFIKVRRPALVQVSPFQRL